MSWMFGNEAALWPSCPPPADGFPAQKFVLSVLFPLQNGISARLSQPKLGPFQEFCSTRHCMKSLKTCGHMMSCEQTDSALPRTSHCHPKISKWINPYKPNAAHEQHLGSALTSLLSDQRYGEGISCKNSSLLKRKQGVWSCDKVHSCDEIAPFWSVFERAECVSQQFFQHQTAVITKHCLGLGSTVYQNSCDWKG